MINNRYTYSVADVASMLTSALAQTAVPAEFRALDAIDVNDWSLDELSTLLRPRSIDIKPTEWDIVKASARDLNLRETVFLALGAQRAWILNFDEISHKIRAVSSDSYPTTSSDEVAELFDEDPEQWTFFKCTRNVVENLAVVPGIELHWFWSTIWVNRGLYVQSALAALLTNLFALATSFFSMIVYNRIIPSNAMESLTVLVTGMLILMGVDYVIRGIRNHFLSIAGLDSDLALADRLFAQVLDLQYKSRKGSVGALANTLKEFEHIIFRRSFCFNRS